MPSISPVRDGWDDCTFGVPCPLGVSVSNGGTAPFTWSATGLPTGLSMVPAGATNTWMTPGDGEIVGVPAELGTFAVTVTVTDADGVKATNTFPLRMSPLMARDFDGNGTRDEAFEPYPFPAHYRRVRVIGGEYAGYPRSTPPPSSPAHCRRAVDESGTQTVSGTPLENGSFNITLNVTDAANPANTLRASQGLQIGGGGTSTISINSCDLGSATIGQSFSYQLSACCIPTPYVWSLWTPDVSYPPLPRRTVAESERSALRDADGGARARDVLRPRRGLRQPGQLRRASADAAADVADDHDELDAALRQRRLAVFTDADGDRRHRDADVDAGSEQLPAAWPDAVA